MDVLLLWHVRHARNLDGSPTEHRNQNGDLAFDEEFDDLKVIGSCSTATRLARTAGPRDSCANPYRVSDHGSVRGNDRAQIGRGARSCEGGTVLHCQKRQPRGALGKSNDGVQPGGATSPAVNSQR